VDRGRGGIFVGDNNKRIDLQVGELAVHIHGIQSGDEVDQDVVDALRDLLEERGGDLLIGRIFRKINGDEELLGLGIDIADVDTTLMGEEDPVALTSWYC
jgi:hypothetical protein